MRYEEIVEKVREVIRTKDVSKVRRHLAYQFNVTGEGEGIFYIEVKEGKAYVEPYDYHDRHACFVMEARVLFDIIEGKLDPVKAYEEKLLHVEGDLGMALKLKDFI